MSCHTAVQRSWLPGGDAALAAAVRVRAVCTLRSLVWCVYGCSSCSCARRVHTAFRGVLCVWVQRWRVGACASVLLFGAPRTHTGDSHALSFVWLKPYPCLIWKSPGVHAYCSPCNDCCACVCGYLQPPAAARTADHMSLSLGSTSLPSGVTLGPDGLYIAPVQRPVLSPAIALYLSSV